MKDDDRKSNNNDKPRVKTKTNNNNKTILPPKNFVFKEQGSVRIGGIEVDREKKAVQQGPSRE
jgi:hypothetical protein